MIDTPGRWELQVWDIDDGLSNLYKDIEELSGQCRFVDCMHRNEPGCAIQEAIAAGRLDNRRLNSYNKMKKEVAALSYKRSGNLKPQRRRAKHARRK